jgi:hypothetical protein
MKTHEKPRRNKVSQRVEMQNIREVIILHSPHAC